MKIGNARLLALGIMAITGCSSPRSNGVLFGGTLADTRAYLDNYAHVFLVCVTSDRVTDGELPARSELHFGGTVVHVYKGGWRVAEKIAWAHELDGKASAATNQHTGELFFVFTNERTTREIHLNTGDWPWWSNELAKQIESALK